jgi:hypothetical protein
MNEHLTDFVLAETVAFAQMQADIEIYTNLFSAKN